MVKNKNNKAIWNTRITKNTSTRFQKVGSALDIPNDLKNFDAVISVMLIHHLIGKDVKIGKNSII